MPSSPEGLCTFERGRVSLGLPGRRVLITHLLTQRLGTPGERGRVLEELLVPWRAAPTWIISTQWGVSHGGQGRAGVPGARWQVGGRTGDQIWMESERRLSVGAGRRGPQEPQPVWLGSRDHAGSRRWGWVWAPPSAMRRTGPRTEGPAQRFSEQHLLNRLSEGHCGISR